MVTPKLIACDIDGTLARDDSQLSAYTESVLRRVYALEIPIIILTGRTESSALGTARRLGLGVPVVSCNGAIVTDPVTGERLWLKTIDPDYASKAVCVAKQVGIDVEVWAVTGRYTEADNPATQIINGLLGEKACFRNLDEVIASESVVKIMLGESSPKLDEAAPDIKRELPGMERSMDVSFEAAPMHGTKQEALAFVLKYLDIDPSDCWGFGDGGNDRGWMATLGRAIAPANARPSIIKIAQQVVDSNDADGPAHYLEDQLLN